MSTDAARRKLNERHEKLLIAEARKPENAECFECTQKGPFNVVMDLLVFVCNDCAGIHRGSPFNHRVKGITASTFTPDEVQRILKEGGNERASSIWLGMSKGFLKPVYGDLPKIKLFMDLKYIKKRFYIPPQEIPKVEPLSVSGVLDQISTPQALPKKIIDTNTLNSSNQVPSQNKSNTVQSKVNQAPASKPPELDLLGLFDSSSTSSPTPSSQNFGASSSLNSTDFFSQPSTNTPQQVQTQNSFDFFSQGTQATQNQNDFFTQSNFNQNSGSFGSNQNSGSQFFSQTNPNQSFGTPNQNDFFSQASSYNTNNTTNNSTNSNMGLLFDQQISSPQVNNFNFQQQNQNQIQPQPQNQNQNQNVRSTFDLFSGQNQNSNQLQTQSTFSVGGSPMNTQSSDMFSQNFASAQTPQQPTFDFVQNQRVQQSQQGQQAQQQGQQGHYNFQQPSGMQPQFSYNMLQQNYQAPPTSTQQMQTQFNQPMQSQQRAMSTNPPSSPSVEQLNQMQNWFIQHLQQLPPNQQSQLSSQYGAMQMPQRVQFLMQHFGSKLQPQSTPQSNVNNQSGFQQSGFQQSVTDPNTPAQKGIYANLFSDLDMFKKR